MTVDELRALFAPDETETVEVKESTGQRGEACHTLCAFLNKQGGTVVFGVTRKGKLTGQLMADTTKRDLFDAFQKFEPAVDVSVEYVPVDETHTAIVCRVERGVDRPYVYDGRPYKRVQSSTTVMSQDEYEKMLAERGGFRSKWEDVLNPELSLNDLDQGLIRETARRAVQCGRLDGATNTDDVEGLLDGLKLRRHGVLLNAAAVLFGRTEAIDYPQLEVKMGWFKGTDERMFLDNRHIQGNIFKLIEESMAFCFKHLNLSAKISGKIERDEELEIPADALREVLINAFAHRSYEESNRTVYLAIYDDRVEIKNPGRFPADFDVEHLYSPPIKSSIPRNEKIARVLYLRKTIETWGRGLSRIVEECNRVGLPLPVTTVEYGNVRTVFKRPDWTRTGTSKSLTGTVAEITGTPMHLTGTVWNVQSGYPLALLPKLRKDARENAEIVLSEIISDKSVTISQICARTGLALRTINNALQTMRKAGILKPSVGQERAKVDDPDRDLDHELDDLDQKVIELISADERITYAKMAERCACSIPTIQRRLNMLQKRGIVRRVGPDKGGHWVISWKGGAK